MTIKLISKVLRGFINYKIKGYGKMLHFDLDSKSKKIDLEIMLDGECEPLRIAIGRYELSPEGDTVRFHDITTSRAWVTTIAQTFITDKPFDLPKEYAKLFKIIT